MKLWWFYSNNEPSDLGHEVATNANELVVKIALSKGISSKDVYNSYSFGVIEEIQGYKIKVEN